MKRALLLAAAMGLMGCDGGDKGLPAEPQAEAADASATQTGEAAAALNEIDRSFAGSEAPDVRLELPGEGETSLRAAIADAGGKRVLVNLWATWCPPCLAEMPALDALAGDAADALIVLPVSQDMEGWQAVDGFFEAGKFSVLTPVLDQPGSLGEALKARGLPMTVLYGPDGKEIWRVSGTPDWASAAVRGDVLS
ncbi:MAG: TlpA family protein disulfide reductase [Polymorphobacter sp.]|uniref:TlpA family protein disulfide reductase n=1 Tax=Polymorphobacter sp. TaxID=1909290 RepID=UPI003A894529